MVDPGRGRSVHIDTSIARLSSSSGVGFVGLADKYGAGDEPAHKGLQEAAERRPSV